MNATSPPPHGPRHDAPEKVADAPAGNWVDRYAPEAARPYLRLARADRPIGTWLLVFPCWWSMVLAQLTTDAAIPHLGYMVLFAIGAFVMRGAGCAYNDYVDREYDAQVARTRSRPIPSGQVSPEQALIFVAALALVGLGVLLQFNGFTIGLGIASLLLVLIYPFMKRFTYWPQVILGLAFNWGALVGWSAVRGALDLAPIMLYVGAVMWTIGYDTIYAHQDKEDDLMLGLKSTAIRFGENSKVWVGLFYAGAIILWASAAVLAGAYTVTLLGLLIAGGHFAWQTATLDTEDADNCLTRFRSNRDVGIIVLAGLVADLVLN